MFDVDFNVLGFCPFRFREPDVHDAVFGFGGDFLRVDRERQGDRSRERSAQSLLGVDGVCVGLNSCYFFAFDGEHVAGEGVVVGSYHRFITWEKFNELNMASDKASVQPASFSKVEAQMLIVNIKSNLFFSDDKSIDQVNNALEELQYDYI